MDFKNLIDSAKKMKDTAVTASKSAVEFSAWKLADSKLTISSAAELEDFIQKSKTTLGTDSQTGKQKEFIHTAIVVFVDTKSEFFSSLLYKFPVLSAKAFSQNVALRLADISMKDLDTKKYKVEKQATLVVFENMKIIKTLVWEENIQKVVKSMSLDITKSIEEL